MREARAASSAGQPAFSSREGASEPAADKIGEAFGPAPAFDPTAHASGLKNSHESSSGDAADPDLDIAVPIMEGIDLEAGATAGRHARSVGWITFQVRGKLLNGRCCSGLFK
eukprot:2008141-Pyramimonas_sp.AAC.1